MIEGRATARYVRGSAQKAKLVLDLIRGRDVNQALSTLRFAKKRVAHDVEKVLRSAIANAQQQEGAGADVDRLYVQACYANQGPTLKRVRPAPMGRAFRIVKRTSHLTVTVRERPEPTTRVGGTRSGRAAGQSPRAAAESSDQPAAAKPADKKRPRKKTTKRTGSKASS